MKKQQGSMLIDIIVSIGIVALLSTISIPYLKRYQPNLKLDGVARDLTSDLRLCQQLSITEQVVYYLAMSTTSQSYAVYKTGTTTPLKTYALPPGISFASITGFSDNRAAFNAYGGVSESGSIIVGNTTNKVKTINIKPSGYVELLP